MLNVVVLFDAENQQEEVEQLKSWELQHHFSFRAYTIKDADLNLAPIALDQTQLVVVLIGASTRFLGAHFINDLNSVISSTKSILCFNLNQTMAIDEEHCPRLLWDVGAIHMPFTSANVAYTLSVVQPNARAIVSEGAFHIRQHPRPSDME